MNSDLLPVGLVETLRGVDDAAYRRPVLEGADVCYLVEETAVGRLLLAARPDGTVLTSTFALEASDEADDVMPARLARLARLVSPRVLRGGRGLDPVRRQLAEYLAGRRRSFELTIDPILATPFQRLVLAGVAASAGYGQTITYGELARLIDRPSAARAVGAALGANPLCVLLPCHRVIAASGALTGYAGGLAAKQLLLTLESSPS